MSVWAISGLTVSAQGHLALEQIMPLHRYFRSVEAVESGPDINRILAGAANSWILIIAPGEFVTDRLAKEISDAVTEPARAWAFRIRTQPMYAGKPLLLDSSEGEVRLVHQRHARLREGSWKVDGTIVRMNNGFARETFASVDAHEEFLQKRGVPHSFVRRILLFTRNAIVTGAWRRSATTLRYLWIEAGYDAT